MPRETYQKHHDDVCTKTLATRQALGQANFARIYQQFNVRKAAGRLPLDCPRYLNIDEHTLHEGQRFCTTFCDLKNRRIFDVQPGNSAGDLAGFLCKLKGRERVKVVCIDLSSGYRHLVRRYFPNARTVADRFHVVRVVQHHFMQLASLLVAGLKEPPRQSRRPVQGTPPARREAMVAARQAFQRPPDPQNLHGEMHQLRELMNHKHQTKKKCKEHIRGLLAKIRLLRETQASPLQTLANTLEDWMEPIACMWRFVRNNRITEGFHRKMKLIQRRAHGFRNFEDYRPRVVA